MCVIIGQLVGVPISPEKAGQSLKDARATGPYGPAVGEILPAFEGDVLRREFSALVSMGCVIEALNLHVFKRGSGSDIVLALEDAEVLTVYDHQFAGFRRDDIIT